MLEELNKIQSYSRKKTTGNFKLRYLKQVKPDSRKESGIIKRDFSSPFISREYELSELKQKYFEVRKGISKKRSNEANLKSSEVNKKPVVIGIKGDAGIGKTRLVKEFLKATGKYSFTGYSESLLQSPYFLFLSLIKSYCGISQNDTIESIKERLFNTYKDVSNYLSTKSAKKKFFEGYNILLHLMGIKAKDSRLVLSGSDLRLLIQISLREFIEAISAKANFHREPLIIVLEDMHWMDSASKNALIYILNTIGRGSSEGKIIFILIYRSVFVPGHSIESVSEFSEIEITSLDNTSVEKMLKHKSGKPGSKRNSGSILEMLSDSALKEVSERSEGNPLFIQEWSRLISEKFSKSELNIDKNGKLNFKDTDSAVPETISSLIQYRIDYLSPQEREVIQTASVIGNNFTETQVEEVLSSIGSFSDLKNIISGLQQSRFIKVSEEEPGHYSFIHSMIQDIIYGTIPENNRKILHYTAAEVIERLFGDNITHHYYSLAAHYGKSDDREKAVAYFEKAGDKARESFENEKAMEYYDRILEENANSTSEYQINIIFKKLGVQKLTGKWEPAIQTCLQYLDILSISKDTCSVIKFTLLMAEIFHYKSDYAKSIEILKRILKKVRQEKSETYFEILSLLCMNYIQYGDPDKAEEYCGILLKSSSTGGDDLIRAKANDFLGQIEGLKGNMKKSIQSYEKSLELYEKSGDLSGTALVLNRIGIIYAQLNEYEKSLQYYERANEISQRIGDMVGYSLLLGNIANIYYDIGKKTEALSHYKKKLEIAKNLDKKDGIIQSYLFLGNYYLNEGDYDKSLSFYHKALEISESINRKRSIANIRSNIGLINYYKGNYGDALDNYNEQLRIDNSILNKEGIIRAKLNIGNLFNKMGNPENSKQFYLKSIKLSEQLGSKRFIAISNFNYAEFLFDQKNTGKAKSYLDAALRIYSDTAFEEEKFECRLLEKKISFYSLLGKQKKLSVDLKNNFIDLNRNRLTKIISETEAILNETENEMLTAKTHFELWKMKEAIKETNMKSAVHRKQSLKIFSSLYKKTPNIEFKSFIQKLSL